MTGVQGTDTHLLTAGTVTGTGVPLYTDANGGAATTSLQSANTILAGPTTGSAATPTFRSLVSADVPTLNQSTSGTSAGLSGTPALPNGTTATTQSVGDTTTKLATDAFAAAVSYPVANTTVAVTGAILGSNTCSSATTVTMTGLTTSMTALVGYGASPAALTGWGSTGGMTFKAWPSSTNTMSWIVCNQTGTSITYSSITFNVGAR